jgi:hypothetical protein
MMKKFKKIVVLTTIGTLVNTAWAIDGVSVEAGEGNMSSIAKLGLQNSFGNDFPFLSNDDLSAYYEFSVAQLEERKYRNVTGLSHSLTDFAVTPAVRWQGASKSGLYGEVGVGLNYMTEKFDNNDRASSTQFQFGDHIGAGYQFANNVDVLLKFQHFSNAEIKEPNPAVNFVMLKLTYRF